MHASGRVCGGGGTSPRSSSLCPCDEESLEDGLLLTWIKGVTCLTLPCRNSGIHEGQHCSRAVVDGLLYFGEVVTVEPRSFELEAAREG